MNEPDVVRHYVNLSQLNYAVDTGFYPLGSCTMKFNPKLNEWAARLPGFADLHPLAPDEVAQGTLAAAVGAGARPRRDLRDAGGHPPAGRRRPGRADRHPDDPGATTGRAGEADRDEVLVPDSSHGTNPATASMAGYRTITIPSAADGGVDVDAFRAALGPRTAAVMITNPSTLGLFEARIGELLEAVHAAGALAYMDGANLNAILGRFKPGEAGFDVMHFNVHKTFSTPHGGGGPGRRPGRGGGDAHAVPARRRGSCATTTARSGSSGPASDRPRSAGCAASSATPASSCARTPTSAPTADRACARSATTPSSRRTT